MTSHDNVTDIVERLQLASTDAIHDDAKAAILEAIQIICNQEADNFALAAGSCDVEGGKIGDEYGNFYCTLQPQLATLRKQLENARSENAKLEAELDSLHRDISMGMYGSQS